MRTIEWILVGALGIGVAYVGEMYMTNCFTQSQMNARAQQESYQSLTTESGKCYFMEDKK